MMILNHVVSERRLVKIIPTGAGCLDRETMVVMLFNLWPYILLLRLSYGALRSPFSFQAELRCIEQWRNMSPMARQGFRKTVSREPIPVNAHLRPDRHFGSISHKMSQTIQSFLRQHPDKISSAQDASPSKYVVYLRA